MNNMNLIPIYPEIFLLIAASAILLIDMFLTDKQRIVTFLLSIVSVLVCAAMSYAYFRQGTSAYLFNKMVVVDPMANLLKLFSYLAVGVTLVYSRNYVTARGIVNDKLGGEFYVLALFSLLGEMVMISGSNLLIMYLGLELMSLSLYALVALRRDHTQSTEAAMKYFILGALASGFLLYGMSMLYGASGSLDLGAIIKYGASPLVQRPVLAFGIVFVVAGLAFKLGLVPFHMWVPDVYQGAPTPVTLLLGAAPKLATFAITLRLLVEGLLPMAFDWQPMLMILAVLSLAIGNITAIVQTNLKRMLAYSTISQMGFMLLGLMSGITHGGNGYSAVNAYGSALFYTITYVLTTLGTFGIILLLSRAGYEADTIDDLKGLNQRSPWFAFVMLLFMFSLAGVPPTIGFYAKFSVLQAVIAADQVWLAVVAVLFSLIGAYYYLRIIKAMYFDAPTTDQKIVASFDMRAVMSLNGVAVLALGLLPGALMMSCATAVDMSLRAFVVSLH